MKRTLKGLKTVLRFSLAVILFALLGGLGKTALALFLYGFEGLKVGWKDAAGLRSIVLQVFNGL